MLTSNEIRQQFIDFFVKKHGHAFVPSSPVVPLDDPTLLFTNAGMNQFKDVFLGTGSRPYKRAANTQKCIRAGGKHNDLDDVGKDTYHHTFFEMLGNWSFGDYFKKEAIAWAWELLTDVWKLDKSRLHVTVFEGDPKNGIPRDDEAAAFWRAVGVPDDRIHLGNKKDNFWEMGDTGPCGPCTEIHIDLTSDKSGAKLVNKGTAEVIEIWNLVFIQYNSYYPPREDGSESEGLNWLRRWDTTADKSALPFKSRDEIVAKYRKLSPLPAKHVDTGMGFERVTAVIQGKRSNYDTDVFTPIMDAFGKMTGRTYGGKLDDKVDVGFRVVADHLRMAAFAISDGARPGSKKRDAVLRSVIRRAVRFGYQVFDLREPFLCRLVPALVVQIGGVFPELQRDSDKTAQIIRDEEADFYKTIQRGMIRFDEVARMTKSANEKTISGDDAADLHTTFGFPVDLTKQMAEEHGLRVDEKGYEEAIERHRRVSRKDRVNVIVSAVQGTLPATDDSAKFHGLCNTGKVLGWVADNVVVREGKLSGEADVALLLDRTNFYAEQGGQVGDVGTIITPSGRFEVDDTQKLGDAILHVGHVVEGSIECGQEAKLEIDCVRADTMRNHTATHLLNWALRRVLGDHVEQKGSLVDGDKTRFDFSHAGPLSPDELIEIERLVNLKIREAHPVNAVIVPLAEAKKIPGVRAVFGEKYPDPVRVVLIGDDPLEGVNDEDSVEFCGGTHLKHTGEAGLFKIVGQEGVAKGVRRVTAVTGREAVAVVQRLAGVVDELTQRFNCKPEEIAGRIDQLQDDHKKLTQQLKKGAAADLQGVADKLLADAFEVAGAKIIVGEIPAADEEQVRQQVDRLRQKANSAVVLLGYVNEDKVQLVAAVTEDLVKKGLHAGKLVGQVAKIVGGGGGGKPTMAQAGGKEPGKLPEALAEARNLVRASLGK